ncbi:MAG TPA: hypothetical protein VFH94_16430 [Streptomyces sp.]|nr:hypothetical protein [Streptomyces sp.]
MARAAHAVPRTRGRGPAAVLAVLLAVLLTLLGPPALGSERPPAAVGSEQLQAAGGTVAAAETVAAQSDPRAHDADTAVSPATVRIHRAATGESPTPPVHASPASQGTAAGLLRPARSEPSATASPASEPPADRHGKRAPPFPSGS